MDDGAARAGKFDRAWLMRKAYSIFCSSREDFNLRLEKTTSFFDGKKERKTYANIWWTSSRFFATFDQFIVLLQIPRCGLKGTTNTWPGSTKNRKNMAVAAGVLM